MTAYLIVEAKLSDPACYEKYKELAQEAIKRHQGRYLVCGGAIEVLEGEWTKPERLVVVEFDSIAQAKTFYNSPEYLAARTLRKDAASMNILVVEGVPQLSESI